MHQSKLDSRHSLPVWPAGLVLSRRHFLAGALGGLVLLPGSATAQSWTPPAYRVVVAEGALKVAAEYSVDLSIVVQKHGGGEIELYSVPLGRTGGSVPPGGKTANFIYASFELRFLYVWRTNPGSPATKESVYIASGSRPISMTQSRPSACSGSVAVRLDRTVSPAVVTITLSSA